MLDRIHSLPINGLYDFSERYKLIKRTGNDLERDKLIEVAYRAIRAIEAGECSEYLILWAKLAGKVSERTNGARIFYDRKSRTTRTWDDLILAHTTPEVAADAFMAAESVNESHYRTIHIWCRRDRLKWRREADEAMLFVRCKRVIQWPEIKDAPAQTMMFWNPWIRPKCEEELADEEAQKITRALDERDSNQWHWLIPNDADKVPEPNESLLVSPWLTTSGSSKTHKSVMRL